MICFTNNHYKHVAKLLRWSVVFYLFTCLQPAAAQEIKPGDIAPFEAVYEVGNNLINAGTATLSLTQRDDTWTYSLKTNPRGVFKLAGKGRIDETSVFELITENDSIQFAPQSYTYRQDDEKRRAVDAFYDWDAATLTHTYRNNTVTENLDEPVLDRLTITLLIMNALRHGFDGAEIPVFDTGKIKLVAFSHEGKETLTTPLGDVETHRVTNSNATGGSRETSTWFAPSLDYLPVKIEHRKRGDLVARLSLVRVENRVTTLELPRSESSD